MNILRPILQIMCQYLLFMMIRLSLHYGAGPVELFDENQSHHLMGECHSAQRNHFVGALVDRLRESIRPTNHKDKPARRVYFLLKPVCETKASHFVPMLIQQHDRVRRLDVPHQQLSFFLFLLLFRESFGVLQLRNDIQGKWHVMRDAANIVLYAGKEMLVMRLPY